MNDTTDDIKMITASSSRGLFAILLGLILVIWPNVAVKYIVVILGIMALILGATYTITYIVNRQESRRQRKSVLPFSGILLFIFGLLLVVIPTTFVTMIMLILGLILIWVAVGQLISLINIRRERKISWIFFLFSIMILASGVVVFLNPFSSAVGVFILFGGTMIFYGVTELLIKD